MKGTIRRSDPETHPETHPRTDPGAGRGTDPVARVRAFRTEVLAAVGDGVTDDAAGVTDDAARVALIAELECLKNAAAAAQARVTVAFADSQVATLVASGTEVGPARRSVGSQVALARRESPSRGDRHVGLARALVEELPHTMASVTAGETSEWRATIVAQGSATLSREDRIEVDRRLAPDLAALGDRALAAATRRIATELDAASVVARMRRAASGRRVTIRPAPDGMAYLSVLGPLAECVGAHAALARAAGSVVGGYAESGEQPQGRSRAQVAADLALRVLSGRSITEPQPVEVELVMTDTALFGPGEGRTGSPDEPALVGGPVPTPVPAGLARDLLDDAAAVWLRRLYTSPDGRDLVAMDSRRRLFSGALRQFLLLRDKTCRTPWCDAPIRDLDHATAHGRGGATDVRQGNGRCQRCNLTKEAPGWQVHPVDAGPPNDADRLGRPRQLDPPWSGPQQAPHGLDLVTPTGTGYRSTAPPVLGWGWRPPEPPADTDAEPADPTAPTDPTDPDGSGYRAMIRRLMDVTEDEAMLWGESGAAA